MLTRMIFTAMLLGGYALAQDQLPPETIAPPTSDSAFLGTWEGQSSGGTWITIKLIESGGKIIGTITRDPTALDPSQEKELGTWPLKSRVVNAKTRGRVLTFDVDNKGVAETYQIKRQNDSQAEIHKVIAGAGQRTPIKSWTLTKTSSE